MGQDQDSRLVYSSGDKKVAEQARGPKPKQAPPRAAKAVEGRVRVQLETKGRKGKGVTVITGLPLDAEALAALAKELKVTCGCGGTVKDGAIEIQGDHRAAILKELQKRGIQAKQAGG
jgi:translation initiation factor 1